MPVAEGTPQTLYDKVFQDHIVDEKLDGTILLYIDRHLVHEVTSPVSSPSPGGRRCTLCASDSGNSKLSRVSRMPAARFAGQTALWPPLTM